MSFSEAELAVVSKSVPPKLGDIIAGKSGGVGYTGHIEIVTHVYADGTFITTSVHSNGKVNQTKYRYLMYMRTSKENYSKVTVR